MSRAEGEPRTEIMQKGRGYSVRPVFIGHFVSLCFQKAVKPIAALKGETIYREPFGVLFLYHFLLTIQAGAPLVWVLPLPYLLHILSVTKFFCFCNTFPTHHFFSTRASTTLAQDQAPFSLPIHLLLDLKPR